MNGDQFSAALVKLREGGLTTAEADSITRYLLGALWLQNASLRDEVAELRRRVNNNGMSEALSRAGR